MNECFDWNLFWTAFGAIGGTFGALATAAAVIVALWQTKFSQRKKVKLTFSDMTTVVSPAFDQRFEYISVTATNIGNREIVISSWGYELLNGASMMMVPDMSQISVAIQTPLPQRLDIEDCIVLYHKRELFLKAVTHDIEEGTLDPNHPVRFYVADSTGRRYHVTTPKPASNYQLKKDIS